MNELEKRYRSPIDEMNVEDDGVQMEESNTQLSDGNITTQGNHIRDENRTNIHGGTDTDVLKDLKLVGPNGEENLRESQIRPGEASGRKTLRHRVNGNEEVRKSLLQRRLQDEDVLKSQVDMNI